jgi:hypothetical protein
MRKILDGAGPANDAVRRSKSGAPLLVIAGRRFQTEAVNG